MRSVELVITIDWQRAVRSTNTNGIYLGQNILE